MNVGIEAQTKLWKPLRHFLFKNTPFRQANTLKVSKCHFIVKFAHTKVLFLLLNIFQLVNFILWWQLSYYFIEISHCLFLVILLWFTLFFGCVTRFRDWFRHSFRYCRLLFLLNFFFQIVLFTIFSLRNLLCTKFFLIFWKITCCIWSSFGSFYFLSGLLNIFYNALNFLNIS